MTKAAGVIINRHSHGDHCILLSLGISMQKNLIRQRTEKIISPPGNGIGRAKRCRIRIVAMNTRCRTR
jgi:hypothetical protein